MQVACLGDSNGKCGDEAGGWDREGGESVKGVWLGSRLPLLANGAQTSEGLSLDIPVGEGTQDWATNPPSSQGLKVTPGAFTSCHFWPALSMRGACSCGLWTLSEGHQKPLLCMVVRITAPKDICVLYGSCISLHGVKRVGRCDQVKAPEMARGPWTIHVSPIESHVC